MNRDFFENRRNAFYQVLPNKSMAVIDSGMIIHSSADNEYPFEVNRNFYYLTGIAFYDMKLILSKTGSKTQTTLFIPRIDYDKEKWVGKYFTKDECKFVSGISNIMYLDELDDFLYANVSSTQIDTCYLYMDNVKSGHPQTQANLTYFSIREHFPLLTIKDLETLSLPLRARKTSEEIAAIQKSCIIAKTALQGAVKNIKPGIHEYEIEACFEYVVKRNGGKPAFNTIAASGDNAVFLHYTKNTDAMKDGDMVLIDCGASVDWYCSDITRTFPVNGKFTGRQKTIYQIVLDANKAVIKQARPGVTLKELNDVVIGHYQTELKKIGLITEDSELSEYYYHGVSHSLGLDPHDPYDKKMPLQAGMIITVEPGLYIAKYGLGIRIEDDVLITEKGCEVLTDVLKEPDEIEEFMNVWEVK